MKLQKSVLREVRHIAIGTVACAVVQLAVFALLGRLDGTVWLGTAVGAGFAVSGVGCFSSVIKISFLSPSA